MAEEIFQNIEDELREKDEKIKELTLKLEQVEKKLNELNRNLEQKVIDRTVEVNKLLKHRTRFIDSLSHDLGTPLTPLVSLLPIVKEETKDEKVKEILDTCIRNAEYIKRVVHNARALADLSQHDLILKKENLYEIVEELIKKYDIVFKSSNIRIKNYIDKNVFVKTEKNRLLQLFDHLSSNAVNSMSNGGELSIDSKYINNEKGTFIQVSFKDTGVGLNREQMDHMFDEFYKTDDSRHKLDSTGLGLAICKNIVEKHGGKIWADSHGKDTGATIFFTLPSPEVVYSRSF
jgi:signal transduction histidine kinase